MQTGHIWTRKMVHQHQHKESTATSTLTSSTTRAHRDNPTNKQRLALESHAETYSNAGGLNCFGTHPKKLKTSSPEDCAAESLEHLKPGLSGIPGTNIKADANQMQVRVGKIGEALFTTRHHHWPIDPGYW